MAQAEIVIPKVWRSELGGAILFLFLCAATVYLSHKLPVSVLRGDILRTSGSIVFLKLPLFWLLPAYVWGTIMYRIYDVRYSMTAVGVEARSGIISFRTVLTRVRYEDILSIEVVQGLIDRFLDVGIIEISTSATGGIEMILEGVSSPLDIQDTLLAERDRRQMVLKQEVENFDKDTRKNAAAMVQKNLG